MELTEVIDRCVIRIDGCIEWRGAHDSKGYAHYTTRSKTYRVFRTLYELAQGPVSASLLLHHRCENRWCVNPDHGEPVTMSEHKAFKHPRDLQTHCRKGHELTLENTYVLKDKQRPNRYQRKCRTCERERRSTPEYLAYMRSYYYKRKTVLGGA